MMEDFTMMTTTVRRMVVLSVLSGCTVDNGQLADPQSRGGTVALPLCASEDHVEGLPSQEKVNRAVREASEELKHEGAVIDGSLWADPERYFLLADRATQKLGCRLEGAPTERRYFGAECSAGVDLSRGYDPDTVYCGGGAGPTSSFHCRRLSAGDCFNEGCYDHDLCYEGLVEERGQVCLFSPATWSCDSKLHARALLCLAEHRCGLRCRLIEAIALNINLIQDVGSLVRSDCIWGEDHRMRADAGVATVRRDASVAHTQPEPTPDAPRQEARLDGGVMSPNSTTHDAAVVDVSHLDAGLPPDVATVLPDAGTPDEAVLCREESCLEEMGCFPARYGCAHSGKIFYSSRGSLYWFPARATAWIDTGRVLRFGSDISWPACSPDGTRVAYVESNSLGDDHLYTIGSDGVDVRVFRSPPTWPKEPAWSPDSTEVVFWANEGCGDFGTCHLYLLDVALDTTSIITTVSTIPYNPSFSWDGTRVLFKTESGGVLHVVNVDGTGLAVLPVPFEVSRAEWSPVDERIFIAAREAWCYSCPLHYYSVMSDGSDLRDYGVASSFGNFVAWSPGGSWVATAAWPVAIDRLYLDTGDSYGGWYPPVNLEGNLSWCP